MTEKQLHLVDVACRWLPSVLGQQFEAKADSKVATSASPQSPDNDKHRANKTFFRRGPEVVNSTMEVRELLLVASLSRARRAQGRCNAAVPR
mmetsp:Transcript_183613/g.582420  ORF Transcript_183613/g.582420 Transcript_183613/m.582420 type:complete len:92 (-) Transcript_183613:1611-1886(-)